MLVGLTGNFGTGKSTVARFFGEKGARVLSADRLAHEVFRKKNPLYPRVRSLFPELKGDLNRTKVAGVVFRNLRKRRELESSIHPYVFRRLREEIGRARERIIVLEIPLLFESGFHQRCHRTIVVRAPEERVIQRLQARRYARREVKARWQAQMPFRKKVRQADYLIDNSDGLGRTRHQVVRIWNELRGMV